MNDRNNNSNYSNKVVDLKPRNGERAAHSQFGNFSADEELLQSTARIKSQRDVIRERLDKMGQAGSRVSKTVYEKVRRDYSLQLETINELLIEKKQLLKEEIKKLYLNREKLSFEINRHREILEEAEFRHFLSEFTQSQYQEVENFETKEIEKLESDLTHISQWVHTHEELFDPEDFAAKRTEAKTKEEKKDDTVTKTVAKPTPGETVLKKQLEPQPHTPPTRNEVPLVAPSSPTEKEYAPEPNISAAAKITAKPKIEDSTPSLDDFSYLFAEENADGSADDNFGSTENNIRALLESEAQVEKTETSRVTAPAIQKSELESSAKILQQQKDSNLGGETASGSNEIVQQNLPEEDKTPPLPSLTTPSQGTEDELLFPEPSDDDYYKQDQVSEGSFRIAVKDEDSVTTKGTPGSTSDKGISVAATSTTQQNLAAQPDRTVVRPDPQKPVQRDDSISNILESIRFDDDAAPAKILDASTAVPVGTEFKLVLTQGDLDESTYAVKDNTAIGRSPSNDVVLKEPKVSRQHAAINKYNDHYILIDLKSSNGVYVNGTKVDECVLHADDEISIGGYKFLFQKA